MIEKSDSDRRNRLRGYRIPVLSVRLARKLSRASVTVRLELIRIGLLRQQLKELYRIKDLIENKILSESNKLEVFQPPPKKMEEVRPTPKKRQEEPVPIQYTPIKERDEDELDDLIPAPTPQRQYPRQSIGQWSVERAKNNMSVRSMISTFDSKRR